MNTHHLFTLTLASLMTLTSCAAPTKKETESTARTGTHGQVAHFEDMVTRGENAVEVLKQKLEENSKVVVDFYAEWCGPCKRLGSVLTKLAGKHTDVLFIKINVDEFKAVSDHYSIKSLPTLMTANECKKKQDSDLNRI
jgi:thioredoxin